MKHIDLEKFASGAFSAQVNRELEKVTQNIQDPNTDATAVRKITVTISLKPNDNRNFVATGVQAKSTLAPALGAVTAIAMGKDIKTGLQKNAKENTCLNVMPLCQNLILTAGMIRKDF